MSDGGVEDWEQQLAALEERPVGEHPAVLDALQRALVEELDALSSVSADRGE